MISQNPQPNQNTSPLFVPVGGGVYVTSDYVLNLISRGADGLHIKFSTDPIRREKQIDQFKATLLNPGDRILSKFGEVSVIEQLNSILHDYTILISTSTWNSPESKPLILRHELFHCEYHKLDDTQIEQLEAAWNSVKGTFASNIDVVSKFGQQYPLQHLSGSEFWAQWFASSFESPDAPSTILNPSWEAIKGKLSRDPVFQSLEFLNASRIAAGCLYQANQKMLSFNSSKMSQQVWVPDLSEPTLAVGCFSTSRKPDILIVPDDYEYDVPWPNKVASRLSIALSGNKGHYLAYDRFMTSKNATDYCECLGVDHEGKDFYFYGSVKRTSEFERAGLWRAFVSGRFSFCSHHGLDLYCLSHPDMRYINTRFDYGVSPYSDRELLISVDLPNKLVGVYKCTFETDRFNIVQPLVEAELLITNGSSLSSMSSSEELKNRRLKLLYTPAVTPNKKEMYFVHLLEDGDHPLGMLIRADFDEEERRLSNATPVGRPAEFLLPPYIFKTGDGGYEVKLLTLENQKMRRTSIFGNSN